MEEKNFHYFYTEASCAMYSFKLKSFSNDLKLSDEFVNAVES